MAYDYSEMTRVSIFALTHIAAMTVPVDQQTILWVYYEDVGGDPVMTFQRKLYLWILMKIRNFQCSDIDL